VLEWGGFAPFADPLLRESRGGEGDVLGLLGSHRRRPRLVRDRGVDSRVRRFLFENSLSVSFLTLFLCSLLGQSLAGQHAYNAQQAAHGSDPVSWRDYVFSTDFGGAVFENWQSEFLQFTLFILATIWLVQRGSNESKRLEDAGLETKKEQKIGAAASTQSPRWAKVDDWRTRIYENSLLIAMGSIFLACWTVQSLNDWRAFNEEQRAHHDQTIAWGQYLLNPDFWERTLENWQSEFLAVGTLAVFTIYLRQRGSPESKPIGAAHEETASSG
jgi:hypothetical protein